MNDIDPHSPSGHPRLSFGRFQFSLVPEPFFIVLHKLVFQSLKGFPFLNIETQHSGIIVKRKK